MNQLTGRAAEADPYLRTAADAEPTGATTIRLADYYVAQNRHDAATPRLNRAKPDGRSGPIAGVRLAELAQVDGRPGEAISIIDGVLKTDPKSVMALSALADVLRRQRKLEAASKAADAAIAADRRSPSAKLARGRVLVAQGHLAEAEQAFQETLQLSPRAAAPQVKLARLHVQTSAADSGGARDQRSQGGSRQLEHAADSGSRVGAAARLRTGTGDAQATAEGGA
jgi:predicted Zn-dependent protease